MASRPLTEEERAFATRFHNLIYSYLRDNNLKLDDFTTLWRWDSSAPWPTTMTAPIFASLILQQSHGELWIQHVQTIERVKGALSVALTWGL